MAPLLSSSEFQNAFFQGFFEIEIESEVTRQPTDLRGLYIYNDGGLMHGL
jgi:hypothetical protein